VNTVFEGNPIIAAVVAALRLLGCITRTNADALLSLTTVDLTEREWAAVLDAFPTDAPTDETLDDQLRQLDNERARLRELDAPVDPFRIDAEGMEHPSWCDLSVCTAPSALRQRGAAEAGVPVYMTDNHLSTPWIIEAGRLGEVAYTVQAFRGVDQPVTDEVEGVDLVAEFTLQNLRVGLAVAVDQLGPLVRAFTGARDTAQPGGDR
jgi:hypothetical protein